jgi:ribosomal protein S18 acetylase RimI-like enzyme
MENNIVIKEDSIEVAVRVNATITEFDKPYDTAYFEERYADKEKLVLVAYVDDKPAGYMVSYDRDGDGSFYCWMAGVDPHFRRLGVLHNMSRYLYEWVKTHGYKKIKIKTRNNRREMLSYLVKEGFYFTGVESKPSIEDNRIFLEKPVIGYDGKKTSA